MVDIIYPKLTTIADTEIWHAKWSDNLVSVPFFQLFLKYFFTAKHIVCFELFFKSLQFFYSDKCWPKHFGVREVAKSEKNADTKTACHQCNICHFNFSGCVHARKKRMAHLGYSVAWAQLTKIWEKAKNVRAQRCPFSQIVSIQNLDTPSQTSQNTGFRVRYKIMAKFSISWVNN